MADQPLRAGACALPPPLDDLVLLAALDGDAGGEVLDHLRQCAYCAARSQDFDTLQRNLRQRLYRVLCPSSDDLLAFEQGTLPERSSAEIAEHIESCPHCTRELRLLQRAARAPLLLSLAPARKVRRVIAHLEKPRAPASLAPLLGGLRGPGGSAQHVYRAENVQLVISIERAAGKPGRLALTGFLMLDKELLIHTADARATLLRHGDVVGLTPIDDLSSFMFDNLPPGEYELVIHTGGSEIVVEALLV